jgi:hypothetical protein
MVVATHPPAMRDLRRVRKKKFPVAQAMLRIVVDVFAFDTRLRSQHSFVRIRGGKNDCNRKQIIYQGGNLGLKRIGENLAEMV